jgi:hypothetical protein
MTKHRPSPSKAEDRKLQFEKLLAATGMEAAFSRFGFTQHLEAIERGYAVAVSGKQPNRKLVRRYRAAIAKLLTLSEAIGPDFFSSEIEKAGWSRSNPDADFSMLQTLIAEHGHTRDVVAVLTEQGLDIDHWLKTSGDVYKKREVRKLVVEPFLQLMAQRKINTSRKERPRKRIFDALFDWIGVEQKFRPSRASIDAIARELDARASSDSDATQRTEN